MRKSTIITVGALSLAIIAVPTVASASNGHAFLLGRSNSATATTTLTNSKGSALSLKAKSGYAPFKVNSSKTVTNLSADRLDGLSSGSFARVTSGTKKAADADRLDGLSSGSFMRATAVGKTGTRVHDGTLDGDGAVCPSGSVATGGGGFAEYGSVGLIYSGPDWNVDTHAIIANSWIVVDDAGVEVSYVNCLAMSGKSISGAATRFEQLVPSAGLAGVAAPNGRGRDLSENAQRKVAQVKEILGTDSK